jgi:hypothetical protein
MLSVQYSLPFGPSTLFVCVVDILQGKLCFCFSSDGYRTASSRVLVIKPLCSMRRPRKQNAQIVL